jgi:hypothetical protein
MRPSHAYINVQDSSSWLTLPGWWVEQKVRGPVTVVNSKSLPSAVRGNGAVTLSPEQIDLIARQLDVLCHDVTG